MEDNCGDSPVVFLILRRHATRPALLLPAALSLTLATSAPSPASAWWLELDPLRHQKKNPLADSDLGSYPESEVGQGAID